MNLQCWKPRGCVKPLLFGSKKFCIKPFSLYASIKNRKGYVQNLPSFEIQGTMQHWNFWRYNFSIYSEEFYKGLNKSHCTFLKIIRSMSMPRQPQYRVNFFLSNGGDKVLKFFWSWLIFSMGNLIVFFPRWGDVMNPRFITRDNEGNHNWITCLLCQKFLGCIELCSFIFISQLFGYLLARTFVCNFQQQELVVWSCGKLWNRVLPIDPKLWTLGHIWELWTFHLIDPFFHCC